MHGCNYVTEWYAMELINGSKSTVSKKFVNEWVDLLMEITQDDLDDDLDEENDIPNKVKDEDDIEVSDDEIIEIVPEITNIVSFNNQIKENSIFELYDNIYNYNNMNILMFRTEQEI